jgi:hypothetical protein
MGYLVSRFQFIVWIGVIKVKPKVGVSPFSKTQIRRFSFFEKSMKAKETDGKDISDGVCPKV